MVEPSKHPLDRRVRDYMARAGIHRDAIAWDDAKQAWAYPFDCYGYDRTKEDLEALVRLLQLAVPGLSIVGVDLRKEGYIWFNWTRQAMLDRYKDLFETYGVADERLAFRQCSGTYKREQLSLPGIPIPEPRGVTSVIENHCVSSSWTAYGMALMDQGFCSRIIYPNRGGLENIPHSNQLCEVGDDWWLVGSKGDSPDILTLEILASPLAERVKENLLYNLRNYVP